MIIQNAVYVPKLDRYFKSTHCHDFVSFKVDEKNGAIDGGNDYIRRIGIAVNNFTIKRKKALVFEFSLDENNTILEVFDRLLWGHRGKDGKQSLTYLPIKDLELEHLKAIKKNCKEIGSLHLFVVDYWIGEKTEEARKQADKAFLIN